MCVGCLFESGDIELKGSVSVGAKVHLNQTIAVGAWGERVKEGGIKYMNEGICVGGCEYRSNVVYIQGIVLPTHGNKGSAMASRSRW